MSKKLLIAVIAVVAVLVLAIGIGVTVMAADGPSPTPPIAITTQVGIIERTAKILGVSTEALTTAIRQARASFTDKRPTEDEYYAKVAELLGNGITKDKLVAAMQQADKEIAEERVTAALDNAVANGRITADEAKQIKDWIAARPSAVDKFIGGFRGFGGRCWGFFRGGMGRFDGFGPFKGGPRGQGPKASPGSTNFSGSVCPGYPAF